MMISFIPQLQDNHDLLNNKNQIKRLFLKSPEYKESSDFVVKLMKAFDLDIVSWLQSGKASNPLEKARLFNNLANAGLSPDEATTVYGIWDTIVGEVFPGSAAAAAPARAEVSSGAQAVTSSPQAAVSPQFSPLSASFFDDALDTEISYINPVLPAGDHIYIPCGFGKTDRGFFIKGIKRERFCNAPDSNVYALVYNFLIRNAVITTDDTPDFLLAKSGTYDVDYKSVFRLAVVLLQMVKNNYMSRNLLSIQFDDQQTLDHAVGLINHYSQLFTALMKTSPVRLTVNNQRGGTPVSISQTSDKAKGITIVNNSGKHSPARDIWYGKLINYNLTQDDRPKMEALLREISPFDKFREGQYETLCNMLSSKKHCVCIMPTGSGKSLIYYLASLLQPLPIFVVSPTDILIQDQIRNLKSFHRIDNVAHLQLTNSNSFADFHISASINYLTPTTLQSRNLLVQFRYINNGTRLVGMQDEPVSVGPSAAYIVLDEIHCLSNWGHDFRPEYLMLSQFLNRYLDRITFWGFTATANYTVVEDVQKQLNIPQENFFSPVSFEKYNVSYYFYSMKSTEDMLSQLREVTQRAIDRNERTIVFTKSDELSRIAAEAIGYEADVFSHDNPYSYHHFVEGKCRVLVASEELGVGINFPNLKNIVHFGLPLSKNEYVQEVGRAGRANERVRSYVIYLDNTASNVPPQLLRRNTDVNTLPHLLQGIDNDFSDVYKKLTNDCPTKDILYQQLIDLMCSLNYDDRAMYINSYDIKTSQKARQHLYMLYCLGYINDWCSYEYNGAVDKVDILIDVCTNDTNEYRKDPQKMFIRMQKRLSDYFETLGNSREEIAKTNRARTPEELIEVFVNWYYIKYLYHHNEQFIDLYEFISNNMRGDNDKITGEIKDYFVLPFIKLKTDEAYYRSLTTGEILEKALVGVGRETLVNLERINSNRYSGNIDLMLFCGNYRMNGVFELGRFERVMSNFSKEDRASIVDTLPRLYGYGSIEAKIDFLNNVQNDPSIVGMSYDDFLDAAYAECDKDLIYFVIIAEKVNRYFDRKGRR